MLSRHTRLVTCACCALVLLLAAPMAALGETVQLNDVIDGKVDGLKTTVYGHGGWSGKCMTGAFENTSDHEITVKIPVGLKLTPPEGSEGVQTMICSGYETLVIPVGTSEHQFTAFCGEKDDGSPGGTAGFTTGGFADKEMIRLLKRINDEGLWDDNAQAAVWSLTDGLDVSQNPEAQQYLTDEKVPAGKAAAAGLGAGLTGMALAEAMRRVIGMGPPLSEKDLAKDPKLAKKLEEVKKKSDEKRAKEDQEALDELLEIGEDDEESKDSSKSAKDKGGDEAKKAAEKSKEPAKPKKRAKPAMPTPMTAGSEQTKIKFDRKAKKLTITQPGLHIDIGKDDFYMSPHAPGTNPFKLRPPGTFDVEDGGTKLSKAGSGISLTTPSGDKKQPWRIYHNTDSGMSRAQKGYFVVNQQGQTWSVEDLIGGKHTGAIYDGSKGDFRLFRDQFSLYRKGEWTGVSETPTTGKPFDVRLRSGSQSGFYGKIGDRWLTRDGDTYGYGWGNKSAVRWDGGGGRASVTVDTHGGAGSTTVMGGRDGQWGVSRTQPICIKNQDIRLDTSYMRYQRDSAGGGTDLEAKWGVGLGTNRVGVSYSSDGKVRAAYKMRF